MRFNFSFTVPANTSVSAPYQQRIKLGPGVLKTVWVRFLAGCFLQVTFRLRDMLLSIIPVSEGTPLTGDDVLIQIPMNYRLANRPYGLILEGTSANTIYAHTLTVSLDVEESEVQDKLSLAAMLEYLESEP